MTLLFNFQLSKTIKASAKKQQAKLRIKQHKPKARKPEPVEMNIFKEELG